MYETVFLHQFLQIFFNISMKRNMITCFMTKSLMKIILKLNLHIYVFFFFIITVFFSDFQQVKILFNFDNINIFMSMQITNGRKCIFHKCWRTKKFTFCSKSFIVLGIHKKNIFYHLYTFCTLIPWFYQYRWL